VGIQLAVEVVGVGFDGAEEVPGDHAVGLAVGVELEDLTLAFAQGLWQVRHRRHGVRSVALERREELDELVRRDGRVQAVSPAGIERRGEYFADPGPLFHERAHVALGFGQGERDRPGGEGETRRPGGLPSRTFDG
jgi:hypothetical protein